MTNTITLNEALAQEIGVTQSPSLTIPNVPNESFYLERFKRIVQSSYMRNGRLVDEDYTCEIYKGFAIVTWKQVINQPNNTTRDNFTSYVWEVGGIFDKLPNLGWISNGCVTVTWNSPTYEKAITKVRKKVDLLSELYAHKSELQALSTQYHARITGNSEPIYNALVGDVVCIRAFGRSRLGKVVKTTGNRFVVAYMTPSNSNDVHYKKLPLSQIYPKD